MTWKTAGLWFFFWLWFLWFGFPALLLVFLFIILARL